jgi:spore maturation protein CgeB
MRFAVFGLTISSSWGNGHATLWRGLCRALHARGHQVTFFERDVPYYAAHRDLISPEGCCLRLYADWAGIAEEACTALRRADVGMITSYCPDGRDAAALVLDSGVSAAVFYDLDTPVTLSRLEQGEAMNDLPPEGLSEFDLVLSYTGGRALDELRRVLGARNVAPLYGSVDPDVHHPMACDGRARTDLSYLGTYAADRQEALARLFLEPARRRPDRRFTLAGSQYPADFPWAPNVFYVRHATPAEHPGFYGSSALTLNVTRRPMALMGHCPSGRLFEAAACGAAILSDSWDGLDTFFEPGEEILIASTTEDALAAIDQDPRRLREVGARARARALACHTAEKRAVELERIVGELG